MLDSAWRVVGDLQLSGLRWCAECESLVEQLVNEADTRRATEPTDRCGSGGQQLEFAVDSFDVAVVQHRPHSSGVVTMVCRNEAASGR